MELRGVMLAIPQAAERVYDGARRLWREIDANGLGKSLFPYLTSDIVWKKTFFSVF